MVFFSWVEIFWVRYRLGTGGIIKDHRRKPLSWCMLETSRLWYWSLATNAYEKHSQSVKGNREVYWKLLSCLLGKQWNGRWGKILKDYKENGYLGRGKPIKWKGSLKYIRSTCEGWGSLESSMDFDMMIGVRGICQLEIKSICSFWQS